MAPPKGNAKKAQQKAARRELQLKKAAAKEQKKQKKQGQIDCDELPIEVLLQQLEEEQRQRQLTKTQVTLCNQPSPRAHASLTLLPSGDLLLFGGESYDGKKVRVYGDLFKWDLDRSEWRRLEAPEMPKARCAHQAVYHNDALYVFGGEFSTYYQFFHFKDFWRFDLKTNLWNKVLVECSTQVPSARSGHRMAVWRGLLILFGGFHDTGRDTRYYNDLHVFSFSENKWRKIEFPPHAHIPEARGGCVFAVVGDVAVLHGGFAKVRDTHKRVQGKTFTDTWLLDLKPLAKGMLTQTPAWEKVKNSGTAPSPRTGMCATGYKSSVIVFGGVADQDDGGTNLSSTFFNDIYSFDVQKRRWYKLELKSGKKKASKKQTLEQEEHTGGERGSCGDDESNEGSSSSDDDDENWQVGLQGSGSSKRVCELQTTFAYFDSKGRLVKMHLEDMMGGEGGVAESSAASAHHRNLELPAAELASIQSDTGSTASCSPKCNATTGAAEVEEPLEASKAQETALEITACKPSSPEQQASRREVQRVFAADVPLPRLHGMLLVRGATLVLMGGIMELGSKEVTLDDCWTLNLNKRDRWVRVLEGTMHEQEWQGAESEAESSSGGSGEEGSSNSGSDASDSEEEDGETSSSDEGDSGRTEREERGCRVREQMQRLRDEFRLDDPMETPAEGESLRGFFQRTKSYWIQKASITALPGSGPKNSKEMTRLAFEAASARVSLISDALRRMEELLQRQQGDFSDDSSPKEKRKAKASSRQRK